MKFKKNGVLYKIAYGYEYYEYAVDQTNLCAFFWRVVFSLSIIWPLIIGSRIFGWIVRIVGAPIALILFGYRPAGPSWRLLTETTKENIFPFVPIEKWPKFNGKRIELWEFLVLILVLCFCLGVLYMVFYISLWQWAIQDLFLKQIYPTQIGKVSSWIIGSGVLAAIAYAIIRKTEPWRLVRDYIKGWKENHCPIVKFE